MNVMVHSMKGVLSLRAIVQLFLLLLHLLVAVSLVSHPVRMGVLSTVQEKRVNFIFHSLHSNPVNHLQVLAVLYMLMKFQLFQSIKRYLLTVIAQKKTVEVFSSLQATVFLFYQIQHSSLAMHGITIILQTLQMMVEVYASVALVLLQNFIISFKDADLFHVAVMTGGLVGM